jgi:uncharacterized membrane protein
MKARAFLNQLHDDEIVTAIRSAEQLTSGEIRVCVSRHEPEDPLAAAQEEFNRLGMARTSLRNGVLIFVAPRCNRFAVIGDTAIHEKCGTIFWTQVAEELGERFGKGEFTAGLVQAIHKAGEVLARHFPRQTDDQNELPDQVVRD